MFSASGSFAGCAGQRFLVVPAAACFGNYAVLLDLFVEPLEHYLKALSRLSNYLGQISSPLYVKKPGVKIKPATYASPHYRIVYSMLAWGCMSTFVLLKTVFDTFIPIELSYKLKRLSLISREEALEIFCT